LEVLERDFKAFSEERGEISIHQLLTHLRDWNFRGERLDLFYRETRASHLAFSDLKVQHRSHKDQSLKTYYLDNLSLPLGRAHHQMDQIQEQVADNSFVPFSTTAERVTWDSQCSPNLSYWTKVWRRFVRRDLTASERFKKLDGVFKEPLSYFGTPDAETLEEKLYW
jgi:hypothetical protein